MGNTDSTIPVQEYKGLYAPEHGTKVNGIMIENKEFEAEPDLLPTEHVQKSPFVNKFQDLKYPVFLMNFPFTISNQVQNNIWMTDKSEFKTDSSMEPINLDLAWSQYLDLYNIFSSQALVYMLPSSMELQDLVYTANLGFMVPKQVKQNTVVVSNFRSSPRVGEDFVGKQFFSMMGFNVLQSPYFFEGEADLKFIGDNKAIGGYGIRTDIRAHQWIEEQTGMKIIPVKMYDDYLYHLDCNIFVLDKETVIANVEAFDDKDLDAIADHVDIIELPEDDFYSGSANSVRLGNLVVNHSGIDNMKKGTEDYEYEKGRIERLDKVCASRGMELATVNISEFEKSGALLSCCLMHMNYVNSVKVNV